MDTNKNEVPYMLSVKSIEKLGFSRTMVYRMMAIADFPLFKFGNRKMVKRDDFFNWLDKQISKSE